MRIPLPRGAGEASYINHPFLKLKPSNRLLTLPAWVVRSSFVNTFVVQLRIWQWGRKSPSPHLILVSTIHQSPTVWLQLSFYILVSHLLGFPETRVSALKLPDVTLWLGLRTCVLATTTDLSLNPTLMSWDNSPPTAEMILRLFGAGSYRFCSVFLFCVFSKETNATI